MRFILNIGDTVVPKEKIANALESFDKVKLFWSSNIKEAKPFIANHYFSIILLQSSEKNLLNETIHLFPHTDIILLSSNISASELSSAFERGVKDFVSCHNLDLASVLITQKVRLALSRRTNERVARIMNSFMINFPSHVYMIRYSKSEESKVVFANNQFLDFHGTEAKSILANPEKLTRQYEKKMGTSIEKNANGKVIRDFEQISAKGKKYWFDVYYLHFSDTHNERIEYSVVVEIDQSYYKTKEKSILRKSQKTISAAKAQEEFLAFTTHEIRKPLNNVIGLLNLLKPAQLSVENQRIITALDQSAKGLGLLLNDLLDLARLNSDQMSLNPVSFDLHQMVENVITSFGPEATEKGLDLQVEIDPKVPLNVFCDENRLQQVLYNLLGNAIKFTHKGHVKMNVEANGFNGNNYSLTFKISDTGIGIEKKKLESIFRSFHQAEKEIGLQFGGTGLGLAITKSIISQFKGSIDVSSSKGNGTTFKIEIPIKIDAIQDSLKKSVEKDLKGLKVLAVDDNEVNVVVLQKLLTKWNAEVTIALSGKNAIESCKSEMFDMVLMDIQMPEMNGVDASKAIRKIHPKIPILALSAFVLEPKMLGDFKLFIDDLLTKPINAEDLYHKIKNLHEIHIRKNSNSPIGEFRIIDVDHLRKFAGNDAEFMKRLIEIFLKRTPEYMTDLKRAIDGKEWKQIKMLAHKLKPTFTYVGMEKFTERVGSIEDFTRQENLDAINNIMDEVWEDCQVAFDEFKDFLAMMDRK